MLNEITTLNSITAKLNRNATKLCLHRNIHEKRSGKVVNMRVETCTLLHTQSYLCNDFFCI